MRYAVCCIPILFSVLSVSGARPGAEGLRVSASGRFYAKGWNVARLDLPGTGIKVESFGLSYSDDGEHFKSLSAGLPRPGGLFISMHIGEHGGTFLVSLVGHFRMGPDSLLFPDPGSYVLRWDLRLAEGEPAYVLIDQPVEILPPTQGDLDFLRGLSDPELIRAMFGLGFFERQDPETRAQYLSNPEMLAVGVIGELLRVTRESDPTRVNLPNGDLRESAELLWQLAQDIPDSSYAPYAAYFAGCCYTASAFAHVRQTLWARQEIERFDSDLAEGKYRASLLKNSKECSNAFEAFAFAAERADAYLKPLVLYQHATRRSFIFDLDKTEELLGDAREAAPGRGEIQEKIDTLRNALPKIRSRLKAQEE